MDFDDNQKLFVVNYKNGCFLVVKFQKNEVGLDHDSNMDLVAEFFDPLAAVRFVKGHNEQLDDKKKRDADFAKRLSDSNRG